MTRSSILDATFAVASRMGLARLTLEDVAREADVSRQTVYRYFGNRVGLVHAVVLREEEALIARMVAAGEGHSDLRPALEAALREALLAARQHPLLDRLLASEPEALLPFLTTGRGPVLSAARPVVAEVLGAYVPHLGQAQLELVADVAARLLVSYAIDPPDGDVDETAAGLADLIVNGVKA